MGFATEFASFSPDGQHLAVIIAFGPLLKNPDRATRSALYITNLDGGGRRQLTLFKRPTEAEDHDIAWSPDGTRLVFTRANTLANPINEQALFTVGTHGRGLRRITDWALNAGAPDWSPDGKQIIFQSFFEVPGQAPQVYTVRPDGSHLHQVTHDASNGWPDFSPDGRKIIFGRYPFSGLGASHIFTMNTNGVQRHQITSGFPDQQPAWGTSPPTP